VEDARVDGIAADHPRVVHPPRITLLTDFGTVDGYVGALKGVIAAIAPGALVDDLTHDLQAGDIGGAAWALGACWRTYPPGTIHVAVVDPGVGTDRLPIVIEADGRLCVGPDNGLFSRVLEQADSWCAREVEHPSCRAAEVSPTFHGRDIFAPTAARLALGLPFAHVGRRVEHPVRLPLPAAARSGSGIRGRIVHVDRYGNAITNIPGSWVEPGAVVTVAGRQVVVARTYGDVRPGELLALIGSRGLLELAVNGGSAGALLGSTNDVIVSARPGDAGREGEATGA
jgi:S-adenosyl-L-methionine hydrolase (adenosine-forming)